MYRSTRQKMLVLCCLLGQFSYATGPVAAASMCDWLWGPSAPTATGNGDILSVECRLSGSEDQLLFTGDQLRGAQCELLSSYGCLSVSGRRMLSPHSRGVSSRTTTTILLPELVVSAADQLSTDMESRASNSLSAGYLMRPHHRWARDGHEALQHLRLAAADTTQLRLVEHFLRWQESSTGRDALYFEPLPGDRSLSESLSDDQPLPE